MPFSTEVKNELARLESLKNCCRTAELHALVRMDGSFHIHAKQQYSLTLTTENAAVARKYIKSFANLYKLKADLEIRRSSLSKACNYLISIPFQPRIEQSLYELGILDNHMNLSSSVPSRLINNVCCQISFLRGAFIGGGFISDPRKAYHLEMVSDNWEFIKDITRLMDKFGFGSKIYEKKKKYKIYLKESETIVGFLALIGAHRALLQFEDTRILKELRNQVNRLVNCETANLDKTIKAAIDQISDITVIEQILGIDNIAETLAEISKLRLAYPRANLRELGEFAEPKLSKSAVYHRLRRIRNLANKLEKND